MSIIPTLTPGTTVLEEERVEIDEPYNLIVLDDPITLMVTVTIVLKQVFGFTTEKAHKHMIEVHTLGRSMVFTGPVGEATNYCVQLHVSGLQAIIEKAS